MDATTHNPVTPKWIVEPDGRLTPFRSEELCSALFLAGEHVGVTDVFLCRELTDGVLHFLSETLEDSTPTREDLNQTVVRVVRELGHPALARAFVDRDSDRGDSAPRPETRDPRPGLDLFPRDLAAAHRSGLIKVCGLDEPLKMSATAVTAPPGRGALSRSLSDVREYVGDHVALIGVEEALAGGDVGTFIEELASARRETGLKLTAHLNVTAANGSGDADTLFDRPATGVGPGLSVDLLRRLPAAGVSVAWHCRPRDLYGSRPAWLPELAAAAEVYFDRPRSPVIFGDGLDGPEASLLCEVGVRLDWLRGQFSPTPIDPETFNKRLRSLVRLAKCVGGAKKEILRRFGPANLLQGFRLDRARLALRPLGLDSEHDRATETFAVIQDVAKNDPPAWPAAVVLTPDGDELLLGTIPNVGLPHDRLAALRTAASAGLAGVRFSVPAWER